MGPSYCGETMLLSLVLLPGENMWKNEQDQFKKNLRNTKSILLPWSRFDYLLINRNNFGLG